MKTYQHSDGEKNDDVVREDAAFYNNAEEQENKRLLEAVNRTDSEKFHFLMTLMKMGNTMKKAVIHHKQ